MFQKYVWCPNAKNSTIEMHLPLIPTCISSEQIAPLLLRRLLTIAARAAVPAPRDKNLNKKKTQKHPFFAAS
jgi:hypothetical protein